MGRFIGFLELFEPIHLLRRPIWVLCLCREVCGADLPLIFLIPPGNSHTGNATNKNANNSGNLLRWTLINVPASSVSEVSFVGIREE